MKFHTSVLLNECVDGLNIHKNGIYIDGTFGGGGHSRAIANMANCVVGIDKDIDAIKNGAINKNITLVHGDFCEMDDITKDLGITGVDGILLDLGVSSYQIDTAERGFSYIKMGQLDMRMDTSTSKTAQYVVNTYTPQQLTKIFREYGEEPFAKIIATAITKERTKTPIKTTTQLANVITENTPKKLGLAPVKRVFQAIRIEVNSELDTLKKTLHTAINLLNVGGRLCIITFHSLEDRIVKQTYNDLQNPCICPRDMPQCGCGYKPKIKIVTKKPILPSPMEIKKNPRAKSAKLRIAQKI